MAPAEDPGDDERPWVPVVGIAVGVVLALAGLCWVFILYTPHFGDNTFAALRFMGWVLLSACIVVPACGAAGWWAASAWQRWRRGE